VYHRYVDTFSVVIEAFHYMRETYDGPQSSVGEASLHSICVSLYHSILRLICQLTVWRRSHDGIRVKLAGATALPK
jgi:hypothetical protein